jgi:DsbC/DsbD-like thiol-disulfide interchange protein
MLRYLSQAIWAAMAAMIVAAVLTMAARPAPVGAANGESGERATSASGAVGAETGKTDGARPDDVMVNAGDVAARIRLSSDRAASGQQLGVSVDFEVAPGWHVYGEPLPESYTPLSIRFDNDLVASQSLDFPMAMPTKFEGSGETLPVYEGKFEATGKISLKPRLEVGKYNLKGALTFQECNDVLCKMPETVRFDLPIMIEPPAHARDK